MTSIQFKGNTIHTNGALPKIGTAAPAFSLTKADLSEITLSDLKGHNVIMSFFPSIDTPTCALSVKKFNAEASQLKNTKVLCISMDLPFAQSRFCGAEGLKDVTTVSAFRHPEFAENYGIKIAEGALAGLFSRAIVIIDAMGKVIYTEQVADIVNEPDYAAALAALK